jgi:flagellin
MIINHNMSAMYANRLLKMRDNAINADIEKLSSGMRINKQAMMLLVLQYPRR